MFLLGEIGDSHFNQGHRGSEGGDEKGNEEQDGDDASERHVGEYERKGLEHESRTLLRVESEGEYGRHDGTACYKGKGQVCDCRPCRVEGNVGAFAGV